MATARYYSTIGLEIHVELATATKMFCGCPNNPHQAEPNTHVCPICLAHPGTLPVPNEEAIALVIRFGEAIGARVADFSEFDRKHYFYPDIPKAYQLSQYAFPFLTGGNIVGVALARVHLEEDTARSQHDKGNHSLLDYNRAGVPLLELVTEPVIHDVVTATNFARELQLILRSLGISKAQMELGEMRVEANVSVSLTDGQWGTKVEVKNLNSFRSVASSISYEIDRQSELLKRGEAVIQETRGWDEVKQSTFTQRAKETAKDYRYFPDPDLPKMYVLTHFKSSRTDDLINKLPSTKRIKYKDIGLSISLIDNIISDETLDSYFGDLYALKTEAGIANHVLITAGNYLTTDVVAELAKGRTLSIAPAHFLELMQMVSNRQITSRVAKDLLVECFDSKLVPSALVKERSLELGSDPAELLNQVKIALNSFPEVVVTYRQGKESALQFLIGQVMKQTRGTANPHKVKDLLKETIG
jgi:aspartyl-tRNA(Asn)/glutamyl-tRNA(Gln) amidotransferase subunit B